MNGGEGGIRTLDRGLSPYSGLANRRPQPLGDFSALSFVTIKPLQPDEYIRCQNGISSKGVGEFIPENECNGYEYWGRSQGEFKWIPEQ